MPLEVFTDVTLDADDRDEVEDDEDGWYLGGIEHFTVQIMFGHSSYDQNI